jgi:hypothetical protein
MTYKDVHDYSASAFYLVPNEDLLVWRKLLEGVSIYKAAAICSSGEVGLLGLLPSVRSSLTLIDHSYRSLGNAMLKYLLIREYGWEKAYAVLTGDSNEDAAVIMDSLKLLLPEKVRRAYDEIDTGRWGEGIVTRRYEGKGSVSSSVKGYWGQVHPSVVEQASKKVGRVKFIHGDMTDLEKDGPFGVFYISNALDHTDRTSRSPLLDKVSKVVKPGGFVLACHQQCYGGERKSTLQRRFEDRGWKLVEQVKGRSSIAWMQNLYQVPEGEAVAA